MIQSKGITIHEVIIPPFSVARGEILIINIGNGLHFLPVLSRLVDLFSNVSYEDNILVDRPFVFASHIKETGWRKYFRSLAVKEHIKNTANANSNLPQEIYTIDGINPKTKIKTLPGSTRKILSVLCALSWSDRIVFDLAGVDPMGAERIFALVKKHVGKEGAAILIDYCEDFENDCSKYVEATYTNMNRIYTI